MLLLLLLAAGSTASAYFVSDTHFESMRPREQNVRTQRSSFVDSVSYPFQYLSAPLQYGQRTNGKCHEYDKSYKEIATLLRLYKPLLGETIADRLEDMTGAPHLGTLNVTLFREKMNVDTKKMVDYFKSQDEDRMLYANLQDFLNKPHSSWSTFSSRVSQLEHISDRLQQRLLFDTYEKVKQICDSGHSSVSCILSHFSADRIKATLQSRKDGYKAKPDDYNTAILAVINQNLPVLRELIRTLSISDC